MNKWMFKVNAGSIALILLCTTINILGSMLAKALYLPFWFDSIGTFMAAVLLGPVAGAISGGLMNIILALFNPQQIWFAIVSIVGGLSVGRFFPRDRNIEPFSVIATALFAGFVMTVVSTPLNMFFNSGYVGNPWGDALVEMMSQYISLKTVCCVAGELLVNMPDKAISIVIALTILFFVRMRADKKNVMQKSILLIVSVMSAFAAAFINAEKVCAKSDYASDYAAVIYGMDDGLVSAEINSIEQTNDGYIWVGAYSGLYRYNGSEFVQMHIDDRINNVIYLYEDDEKRLWIGTNDCGVACYNIETGEVKFYTTDDGLSSDSIRSICEDEDGHLYVSTTDKLCRIDESGDIHVYEEFLFINCVYSLNRMGDSCITGVTSDGLFFILDQDKLVAKKRSEDVDYSFTASACGRDGEILVGTSSDKLLRFSYDGNGELKSLSDISVAGINYVNYISYNPKENGYFVGASTGLVFVDENDKVTTLSRDDFKSGISDVITDYQDDIWFASSKQGIMKLSYNPFSDVFKKAGISSAAVNAIFDDNGRIYVGTDTGLLIISGKDGKQINDSALTKMFDGVRVRHIMKDSRGNLFVSTYGTDGLICISSSGDVTHYGSDEEDVLGGRFRLAVELSDGVIVAVSTEGLNYIKDGKVIKTLGTLDGLEVPQILSLMETEDGELLAGSDGNGIYVIKDRQVAGHIGEAEGLLSQVVLRIVKCSGGYIYVTSNGLYYDNRKDTVRKLKAFPYNNNYDVYITGEGDAWISSSAGIFVVREDALIKDKYYQYILLNHTRGFDTTLTANAWNAVAGSDMYLCCTDGIRKINLDTYNDLNDNYKMVISSFTDDGEQVAEKDGVYDIPSGSGRIEIKPAVLNYSLSNPLVSVHLEGTNEEDEIMYQNELTELSYTTLPYGNYRLSVKVLDELSGEVKREESFNIHKDSELYERGYYKLYLIFVSAMLVAFLAWMIAKMGNMAVINRQYEQIREAKEEAEYANKAKSIFLANMSHEIRTPINAVLGMDEMILRESNEKEIRGYASDIYTAGNTLLSLINDILDSSKIESGKMEIIPVEYELSTLIRDLVNMITPKAVNKDLSLITEVDSNLPKVLFGDDVRIRQVITNILTNAVKYTHEGCVWLRVSGRTNEDSMILHVEIEDTGIGIKEEDLPKLFEAFQRIEEGKNRNIEGTGLGMNITLSLLSMMGSELKVESEYGKGSKFYFDLEQKLIDPTPIGDFGNAVNTADERYHHESAFIAPDAQVLVVDDNEMNRKVFKSLLKVTRVNISEAENGFKALELAEGERFDMVFMDHMMPDMDGVETMERMRKLEGYDKIPIFVLTANAVTGAKESYLAKGFDGFISKPIVSDRLEEALRDTLPSELIKPYEGDAGETSLSESNYAPASLEELPAIDGIDWNYAWMHLPDMELLEDTVRDFHKVITNHADKLSRMYKDIEESKGLSEASTEAFSAYRIQVHGMKSAAATIGIVPLAGMAKVLEFAARDSDIGRIESLHGTFIEEWTTYEEKLKGVFGIVADEVAALSGDEDMLRGMLQMLKNAFEDFDVDAADDIMKKIKSYSYSDKIDEYVKDLSGAVADLDEDAANEIMKSIEEELE